MPLPPEDAKVFGYITSTSLYQFILATNISHNMSMPPDTALPCHQHDEPLHSLPPRKSKNHFADVSKQPLWV